MSLGRPTSLRQFQSWHRRTDSAVRLHCGYSSIKARTVFRSSSESVRPCRRIISIGSHYGKFSAPSPAKNVQTPGAGVSPARRARQRERWETCLLDRDAADFICGARIVDVGIALVEDIGACGCVALGFVTIPEPREIAARVPRAALISCGLVNIVVLTHIRLLHHRSEEA